LGNELNFLVIKVDEARVAGTQLLPDIIRYTKECDLGIVILDGLRPNVVLELGMILACQTPCIILVEKEAEINVGSLLKDIKKDSKSVPKIKIDVQKHISDISNVSWNVYDLQDDIDFRKQVRSEVKKLIPVISKKSFDDHKSFSKQMISLLSRMDNSKKFSSEKFTKLITEAKKMVPKLSKHDGGHIFFHIVRSRLRRSELQTALREAVQGLQIDPNFDHLWFLKGRILILLGQQEEGLKILKTISQKNPKDKEFLREHLNALINAKNSKLALKILSKFKFESLLIDNLIPIKSHALFSQGDFEESLNLLVELYEYDLNKWAVHHLFYLLSNIPTKKFSKKFINKINHVIRMAVDQKHLNCDNCIVEGSKAIGLNDFMKEYLAKRFDKIDRKDVDGVNEIIFSLIELGEYAKVESRLKDLIKKHPKHCYLNATMGMYCLIVENNIAAGQKYYLKAIKLSPDDLPLQRMYLFQLGDYYSRSRNKRLAKKYYEDALAIKTDFRTGSIKKALQKLKS
jgi:tetratricopeptide (TPR) repeat protein